MRTIQKKRGKNNQSQTKKPETNQKKEAKTNNLATH
jgi:hypothetical protein